MCALGITEPGAGSDMAALATRAVRDGDVYRLTGSKIFITNGVYGDLYFVAARQALRHRVADLATSLEAARRLVYHAASLYAAGADCVIEVSMAKLFATETANRVAYEAVQMHGGYGYMREFPVERFFRDVRLWTIASGTSEVMREIIAKRLLP